MLLKQNEVLLHFYLTDMTCCQLNNILSCGLKMSSKIENRSMGLLIKISNIKKYIRLTIFVILISLVPLIWLFFIPLRLFVIAVTKAIGNYGQITGFYDGLFDEDFVNNIPRGIIVTTLELSGDVTVQEVRSSFKEKVLNSVMTTEKGKRRRYPELQQYLTSVFGYRIWRNDEHFRIENHIKEESFNFLRRNSTNSPTILDLGKFHEKLINTSFQENRSPWEIIIVRNVIPVDGTIESDTGNEISSGSDLPSAKTIIALRMHHVMADAKSILKIFVERLGNKALEMPAPHPDPEKKIVERLLRAITFPFRYFRLVLRLIFLAFAHHMHPWKTKHDDDSKLVVKFSRRLSINHIKGVAKRHNVLASAVFISTLSGAIGKYHEKEQINEKLVTGYILPKKNHPETLANHMYGGAFVVPSDEKFPWPRLQKSNEIFKFIRQPEQGFCGQSIAYLLGTLPFALTKYMGVNFLSGMGITNIAGDKNEFSICDKVCTGFRMSVGVMPGCAGVVFLILSYKDSFRVAVIGKESVFTEDEVEHLATLIGTEFDALSSL